MSADDIVLVNLHADYHDSTPPMEYSLYVDHRGESCGVYHGGPLFTMYNVSAERTLRKFKYFSMAVQASPGYSLMSGACFSMVTICMAVRDLFRTIMGSGEEVIFIKSTDIIHDSIYVLSLRFKL